MPCVRRCSFERWDLEEPSPLQPTSLYSLTPCGLATPYVESLSSYVTRLAEAHVVSVWRLILHVLSPERSRRVPRSDMGYTYPANGLGKSSEAFVRSFETATGRGDLRLLTLSALQGAIAQPNIFRITEAWCPGCLEQWRKTKSTVYSPLLWAMRVVKMCPAHTAPLVDRCPRCHAQFAPLKANARPGYCSVCSRWLGTLELPVREDSSHERAYDLWTSTSLGQVLAAMPDLHRIDLHKELPANLQLCLSQSGCVTRQRLTSLAGVAPGAFWGWVSGRIKPTLDRAI